MEPSRTRRPACARVTNTRRLTGRPFPCSPGPGQAAVPPGRAQLNTAGGPPAPGQMDAAPPLPSQRRARLEGKETSRAGENRAGENQSVPQYWLLPPSVVSGRREPQDLLLLPRAPVGSSVERPGAKEADSPPLGGLCVLNGDKSSGQRGCLVLPSAPQPFALPRTCPCLNSLMIHSCLFAIRTRAQVY